MSIIVDGDGCAGRNIIEDLARKYNVPMRLYCDYNHFITMEYSEVIVMDAGFQAVDMKIANEAKENDIVVTQDFGVAAMVLGKKALAISPKGYIYSEDNIDKLLFERHISAKVRRSGGRTGNPKKRTEEDNERLRRNMEKLIKKSINASNDNE